jgi:hypothetical protein
MKQISIKFLLAISLCFLDAFNVFAQKTVPKNVKLSESIKDFKITVQATKNITADNQINNSGVVYLAGESVLLNPGFHVTASANFMAKIGLENLKSEYELPEKSALLYSDKITMALGTYPNPFVESTTIEFRLPKAFKIDLVVFDTKGVEVKRIINQEVWSEGLHAVNFGSRNLMPGIYICVLSTDQEKVVYKFSKQ